MLELHDIKKDYAVAGETVQALKGISLKFRKSGLRQNDFAQHYRRLG